MFRSIMLADTIDLLTLFLISLELPAIVGLFLLVGYLIGDQYGNPYGLVGALIGGVLGFIAGAMGFLKLLDVMGRKRDKQAQNHSYR